MALYTSPANRLIIAREVIMGRIAPRKNKTPRFSLSGLAPSNWKWRRGAGPDDDASQDDVVDEVPDDTSRPSVLLRLWHWPDSFNWMRPLPLLHRRWLLIAALVVVLALMWPDSPEPLYAPAQQAGIDNRSTAMQADLVDNTDTRAGDLTGQRYRINDGQTLAQLFRAHNLPVNDVFAMAQVEGSDKPLSNLQAGQQVRIVQNAQGEVTQLEIETGTNTRVRFTRLADGSYQRN